MRIKEILNQHRRDFNATYECEHCGFEYRGPGYDDHFFGRPKRGKFLYVKMYQGGWFAYLLVLWL